MKRAEDEILFAIARREVESFELKRHLDWEYLFATASRHGLIPLLQKNLHSIKADLIPTWFLSRLKLQSVSNLTSVLHLLGKQLKLYRLLQQNEIPAAIFKGSVLAQIAYGDISLRQAGDIDVLILPAHFDRTRLLLESLGYQMWPPLTSAQLASHLKSHCEIQFMRDDWFTVVDLHWQLAPRSFVLNVNADEVMSRLQSVSLAGTEVETFSAEDSVLYQSMHGAKHLWRRLEWISALAETLRASPEIAWDVLLDRATRAHATRMLGLGLRLVEEFSDVPVPPHLFAALDSDGSMQRMAQGIRTQIFTTYGAADSTETNLYNLRIMDRKRDALISALRAIFVPTVPDWQALSLPASLQSLYYAVRPLRLSRIYASALLRRVAGND